MDISYSAEPEIPIFNRAKGSKKLVQIHTLNHKQSTTPNKEALVNDNLFIDTEMESNNFTDQVFQNKWRGQLFVCSDSRQVPRVYRIVGFTPKRVKVEPNIPVVVDEKSCTAKVDIKWLEANPVTPTSNLATFSSFETSNGKTVFFIRPYGEEDDFYHFEPSETLHWSNLVIW